VTRYGEALIELGFAIPENYKDIRPSILPEEWADRVDEFLDLLNKLI
jgi:hypothetical protein